jgi:hypothetical protein
LAIADYITDDELKRYIQGVDTGDATQSVVKIMSTKTRGIEGLPYQFMESVDRRIFDTEVGRKYGERIFGRLPLLFLTPCEPLFMDDFDKSSKNTVAQALLGSSINNINELINGTGRYYSVDFNYAEYYDYLNTMLACLSAYLGIFNTELAIGDEEAKKIGTIDWSKELNSSFKTFFSAKENIIFYLDGMDSVSESFSNTTSESSIASTINGITDSVNEIRFLFGSNGSAASALLNAGTEVTSSITSALSNLATTVGGGIVGSLSNKGVNSVLNGGKIIFPEIWTDSDFSRSYTIDIKLRSPDHDNLSIFLNILKPYCKLLALTLPRSRVDSDGKADPNSFEAPFLVKAYSKGMFNIDMGIISSMTVTKGRTCAWNDDGLPTEIDISLDIKDLYSNLSMSSIRIGNIVQSINGVVSNTAYMDFLANMAGLNIAQMEVGRRITMAYYLVQTMTGTAMSSVFNRLDQGVSKLIGKMYNIL